MPLLKRKPTLRIDPLEGLFRSVFNPLRSSPFRAFIRLLHSCTFIIWNLSLSLFSFPDRFFSSWRKSHSPLEDTLQWNSVFYRTTEMESVYSANARGELVPTNRIPVRQVRFTGFSFWVGIRKVSLAIPVQLSLIQSILLSKPDTNT